MSATPQVYAAIAAVQNDLAHDGIAKDRKNTQQGYAFRGIDDVFNALSPLLARHQLCILPRMLSRTVSERLTKSGGALFGVVVEAEFDFVSAKDGSKHTVKMFGEAMDSADKATNKAMSAAYKYAALQAFCVPTEAGDDADFHTPEPAAKPNGKPAAPPSQAVPSQTDPGATQPDEAALILKAATDKQVKAWQGWLASKHSVEELNRGLQEEWADMTKEAQDAVWKMVLRFAQAHGYTFNDKKNCFEDRKAA